MGKEGKERGWGGNGERVQGRKEQKDKKGAVEWGGGKNLVSVNRKNEGTEYGLTLGKKKGHGRRGIEK